MEIEALTGCFRENFATHTHMLHAFSEKGGVGDYIILVKEYAVPLA